MGIIYREKYYRRIKIRLRFVNIPGFDPLPTDHHPFEDYCLKSGIEIWILGLRKNSLKKENTEDILSIQNAGLRLDLARMLFLQDKIRKILLWKLKKVKTKGWL